MPETKKLCDVIPVTVPMIGKLEKIRLELGMISSFDLYQPVGHIKIMGVSAKIAELTGIGRRSVKGTGFRLRLSGSKVS